MSKYREILLRYWGYGSFRPLQEDIVESVGAGNDTLALMPTGGGKSITFQVPAMVHEGICLVVTPLISLMKDQVENLKRRKIKAMAIHSGMTRDEIGIALDNCIYGGFKFLYLSPERLATDLFRARVQHMKVSLVAVDEAHCISQWGYDFRPSYLRIAELRELVPDAPVLALTATATEQVAGDIMEKLRFRKPNLLKKSFERKNLVYVVRKTEDKPRELLNICRKIAGPGVVYVRSRKKTAEFAALLRKNGVSADHYHAGLKHEDRNLRQDQWQKDATRVMVATNAFGMGIDKPDVRFVIHMDLPDSPEAYFQEAGRAGRDEKRAWAILLYSPYDKRLAGQRIDVNFPGIQRIKEVYTALGNYLQLPVGSGKGQSYDFILGDFLSTYRFHALVAVNALDILMKEGYLEITEEIHNPSRVHFIVDRDALYKFQVKNRDFDAFIKLLLRSYSGLFSQYVPVDEAMLARRSGLKPDDVYKYLVALARARVINYIPKKRNPVITLLEERLDDRTLHISPERYRFRKERYASRIHTMVEYATSETKCRSQFLLAYFGETDTPRCGQCDVCLERNELDLSNYEFDLILEEVKQILEKAPVDISSLAEQSEYDGEKTILVAQWLLERGKVVRNEDTTLAWHYDPS